MDWIRQAPPVPIRWLPVRDPSRELEPQGFLATGVNANPEDMIVWFAGRWQAEVTFEDVRAHLGAETQRRWTAKAILRTAPALPGLFSIVVLWTHDLAKAGKLKPRCAAWYPKPAPAFSDAIAPVVRRPGKSQIGEVHPMFTQSHLIEGLHWPNLRLDGRISGSYLFITRFA